MSQIKKNHCYTDLLGKMDALDMQVNRIKQQLKELKNMIKGTTNIEPTGPPTENNPDERPHKRASGDLTNLESATEGEEK
jgi:hypothetical protein